MSCQVKINTIDLLKKKNVIDDFSKEGRNRILLPLTFDELNKKYTELAKLKYPNLVIDGGELLFSIEEFESVDPSWSRYGRDSKYTTRWSIPNIELFDKIQVEFDKVQAKVDFSLKIINALDKINRNKFETSKLQGWLNDLQKQGISGQQLELFKEIAKPGMTKDEIATAIAAAYSYAVEINTAKDSIKDPYNRIDQEVREINNKVLESVTGGKIGQFFIEMIDESGDPDIRIFNSEIEAKNALTTGRTQVNSRHYSNLTVPGGTNYTENEIVTPDITPNIKGHAQFSTDNGIGWFRSDDHVLNPTYEKAPLEEQNGFDEDGNWIEGEQVKYNTIGGTPTKTRRILEVQSDLFQKGRNSDLLVNTLNRDRKDNTRILQLDNLSYDRDLTKEEETELKKLKEPLLDEKGNQFLQLLNKDNNWVTFFLKSIIQDSGKKGYEKVLFPTGNTASIVEGHQTLETRKQNLFDSIKLNKDKIVELQNSKYEDGNYAYTKEVFEESRIDGIKELTERLKVYETQLKDLEEGGFAKLKPIYNFYENTVTNILNKQFGKERVKKITDEYGNTWNEVTLNKKDISTISFMRTSTQEGLQNINGIPLVDINLDTLKDSKSKAIAEVLAKKLSLGLKVKFENITPEQAAKITRVSATPYNGEAAFYYAGTVYVVGDNVNVNTVLHEFSHPVINGIRVKNKKLFDNLYEALILTPEGQQIRDNVLQNYPELKSNEDMLKSEILTYGLQVAAANKLTDKIQTEGFEAVINKILAAIKELIRGIFGNKQGISDIDVDTTIDELGRMLLENEIDISDYDITEDDLIQYGKFVTERANELTKSISEPALEKIVNEWYSANKAVNDKARNFRSDKVIREMLVKSIFGEKEGSTNLLPEAVSSLRRFQTVTDFSKFSTDELMDQVLDSEEKRIKDLDRKARALINSIDKIDIISQNMLTDLAKIYKEKNVSARNTIALVNLYKENAYTWKETIDMFNEIIRSENLVMDKDNLFYRVLNKINGNLDEIEVIVSQIYKKNNIQFYVELTGPMNQFVEDEFKKNLGTAFKNAYKSLPDREAAINSFYNKVISQEDVTDDLEALYKNGVPKDVLIRFLDLYQNMIATPEKIQNALTGHSKDVSWFNRFLESYTSSNDPIVGSLALFIQNQRTEITNDFMDESGSFLKTLEKLLPQVNFSKLNVTQIQDMVTYEDTILYWDKETGKPVERKIRTFLHEFGNGYRYAEDILEYNLAEARTAKDQEKITKARDELKQFRKDYMWQEFVPEYYESDKVYDELVEGYDAITSKRISMEAYSDRQNALDDYNNLINEHDDELSRFTNYSSLEAAFRKFKQLSALVYEDGTAKVDDPKKGIFDLSKAKVLQKVSKAKSNFYEFVPLQKSLESAYNEFINNLGTEGITRSNPDFDKKIKEWKKQNLTMRYDPKYAQRRTEIINRINDIQSKLNWSFDMAGAYKEINDLIFTYRDELGQPITPELGEVKVKRIQELEQGIINFRESLDRNSGLSQEERAYLNSLTAMVKRGVDLSEEQKRKMISLLQRQSQTGLSIGEAAELENLFAELGELSEKIPTDYYMDALNFHMSRLEQGEVPIGEVEKFINQESFQELLEKDATLSDWFEMNHVSKKRKTEGRPIIIYEPTIANRLTVPVNKDYILTTTITDQETGEPVKLQGVPNARHSRYQVKNEFRTIPIGESWDDYVGTIIDNKGNYLPRLYQQGTKNSAKDAKFMNNRYFDLKRSNNAEFKLLEEMKKFHLGVQKGKSNYSKLYLDMPRHALKAGDIYQLMQRGKLGERFKTFTDWKNQLVGKSVTDFERGYNYDAKNNLVNTDLKGNEVTYVPVEGIYNLELENTDADIITGLFKYGMSIKTQGKLLESLPLVESIVSTLEDPANQPKNMETYSKGIFNVRNLYQNPTKAGAENNRLGQVRSLIEREYRGQQTGSFEESNPRLSKWLDIIQGLSTRASLAVNIPSDLKNQFSGYIQSMIESIGGEFITAKDYASAVPWASQAMLTWAAKDVYAVGPGSLSGQMIQRFDPTFISEDKFGQSVSKSIAKDLTNGSWMYAHRKFGEMDVAVKLFASFLHGQKVNQLVAGKQVFMRYVDAFELDKDGLMKLKIGVDAAWDTKSVFHNYTKGESLKQIADKYNITVEELKKRNNIESEIQLEDGQEIVIAKSEKFKAFKNRLQGTSRRLFGAYDRFGQPEGNKFIAYRMFFFMRKWFTPMLTNRWGMDFSKASLSNGGERYDWALGRYTKGYYVNAFQTLVRVIKSKGAEMSYMTDQEKADFKRTAAEGLIIIAASILASMLLGFDPDDDDKWDKIKKRSGAINEESFNTYGFFANHMLLLLLGVQAETSAFVPLPKIFGVNLGADDYTKMLTSTSASWYNTVVLYVQIMGDVLNFVTFDEAARYDKNQGPYWWQKKDSMKIWKRLFSVFGFTGGSGDPSTVLKNFQNSSSRYGG